MTHITLNDNSQPASSDADFLARVALDALSCRLCVLDEFGRIILANKTWREFVSAPGCASNAPGNGNGNAQAIPWTMACWSPETSSQIARIIEELLAGTRQTFALEYECRHRQPFRWFEFHVTRLPGAGPARLLMTHDDISARKSAEGALRASARRLKEVGAHLESVREEQSATFAREMHDELGAILTMLKLELATTATQVAKSEPLRTKFTGLVDQVAEALKVVKRISSDLRPATLDTLGLIATIRWYVDQFSCSTQIPIAVNLPEYVRLSDVANIAVFRIIQESLTNVAKHSGARKATISVEKQDGKLIVEISDNGKGIAEADLQHNDAFGVVGMRERAGYLGGTLSVSGSPDTGTRVILQIPLDS